MGTSCCKEAQDIEEGAAPSPAPHKKKAASPSKKAKDEKGAFKKKYILGGKLGSVR